MPIRLRMKPLRRVAALTVATATFALLAGCGSLDAVRDFSRSAAAISVYPQAADVYVDSAVTSAPYLAGPVGAGSPQSLVTRGQRQQQVDAALALQALVGQYFATLARLAGDDGFTLATLKSMDSEVRAIRDGDFDKSTLDAYGKLSKTLGEFAQLPARESAVKELVQQGGPSAMRILDSLRLVSTDWRAQVSNDAKQVDDTLGVAVMPRDVPPLLRVLANDRKQQLASDYAANLRRMRAAENALAAVETAHADMASHLDDLHGSVVTEQLKNAAASLRAARAALSALR